VWQIKPALLAFWAHFNIVYLLTYLLQWSRLDSSTKRCHLNRLQTITQINGHKLRRHK